MTRRERFLKMVTNHGLCGTRISKIWKHMKDRCFNKRGRDYRYYGGRGITVCAWLSESPRNLLTLIGHPPKDYTLDRKDNSGNYSCGNCKNCLSMGWKMNVRWASRKTQSHNSARPRFIEIDGRRLCVSEWSVICGVPRTTIQSRLKAGKVGREVIAA